MGRDEKPFDFRRPLTPPSRPSFDIPPGGTNPGRQSRAKRHMYGSRLRQLFVIETAQRKGSGSIMDHHWGPAGKGRGR